MTLIIKDFEKNWAMETGDQAINTIRSRLSHQPTPLPTVAVLVIFWDYLSKETSQTGWVNLPVNPCVKDSST